MFWARRPIRSLRPVVSSICRAFHFKFAMMIAGFEMFRLNTEPNNRITAMRSWLISYLERTAWPQLSAHCPDADGRTGLSVEMRPKAPLFLTIPEDRNLILSAIGCGWRVRYTGDFGGRSNRRFSKITAFPIRHAIAGVSSNLFGGLQSAHQMFESRFWRRNIYRLANVREKTAVDTDSPLFRKLSKHPELWAINPDANLNDELHRLEAQIVKFARSVRSSEAEVTYRFLIEDFKKGARGIDVTQNPHLAPKNEDEAKDSATEAEGRLKLMLQELVDSIFFQQRHF